MKLYPQIFWLSALWLMILCVSFSIQYEWHAPPPPTQAMVDAHWRELHSRDMTEYEQQTQTAINALNAFFTGAAAGAEVYDQEQIQAQKGK